MKVYFDLKKAKLNGIFGGIVLLVLLFVCFFLIFFFLKNPHKELHQKIFSVAEAVHTYYRDRPGYWKLSTETAKQNGLVKSDLLNGYKEYDFQIGQGIDGQAGLPSDMTFDISLKHLNKSACVSLMEMNVSQAQQLILMKITIANELGSTEFSWGGEHKLPIPKYSAKMFCRPAENTVVWTFQ